MCRRRCPFLLQAKDSKWPKGCIARIGGETMGRVPGGETMNLGLGVRIYADRITIVKTKIFFSFPVAV
jgi:hypothetical protein